MLWPVIPKLPCAKRPHLYKGLPASPALSKTGHRYLWGWKLPVSSVQQGESQPMQIQQVLAVTEGHREKRHRETAVPFELVHERRHLSARCLALKGSLQWCELAATPSQPLSARKARWRPSTFQTSRQFSSCKNRSPDRLVFFVIKPSNPRERMQRIKCQLGHGFYFFYIFHPQWKK